MSKEERSGKRMYAGRRSRIEVMDFAMDVSGFGGGERSKEKEGGTGGEERSEASASCLVFSCGSRSKGSRRSNGSFSNQ